MVGLTCLHLAASNQNENVINLILQYNPNINYRDTLGRTPLHMAAGSGNEKGMQILLNKPGIDVNALSNGRETPLMRAVVFGRKNCVEMLIKAGADPNIKNISGQGANDIALGNQNIEILNLL